MTAVQTAADYFKAVQTGDVARLGELVSANVVWKQPGANQFSGVKSGAGAVFGMITGMMEASQGTFKIETVDFLAENSADGTVGALLTFSATRDGKTVKMRGIDVLRIENGQIVEANLYSENQSEEDALWGALENA